MLTNNFPNNTKSFEKERTELNNSIINLERKHSEVETLYEIARVLNSTLEFDEVLRLVMDRVIEVVNAERGFLVLLDPQTSDLRFEIARDKEAHSIDVSVFNSHHTHDADIIFCRALAEVGDMAAK